MKYIIPVLFVAGLMACSPQSSVDAQTEESTAATLPSTLEAPTPVFHADTNPKSLSEWGMLASDGKKLQLGQDSFLYGLRTPLFSDYAEKLRTIHIPHGKTTSMDSDNDRIIFPVGTIITKTFSYPLGKNGEVLISAPKTEITESGVVDISSTKLIETRLLVRRETGWDALPYVWNADQTDARLSRTGDIQKLKVNDGTEFAYVVPNVNQCAGCHATNHTTKKIVPIGPRLRHLLSSSWMRLEETPQNYFQNAVWDDPNAELNERARAYLDINCSHCHNEVGPADTSGLHLEPKTPMGPYLGLCKTPIAAGTGTGNRKHGIVPGEPDASIFVYRMASTNPAEMMPELGRSLAHEEGVALIREWIDSLEGSCSG